MIIPLLDVISIKSTSYQRISPEEYIKRNDERNAHNTFSFKIRNSLRISLPLGRKKDCGSLTMRSFERDNHRNLGDKGGERRAGKDFRRFTLRSGCAPHCWPCQLYTRPETQRRHLRDGHAPIHTHRAGRKRGGDGYRQTILPTQTGLRIRSVHTLAHMTAQDNPI